MLSEFEFQSPATLDDCLELMQVQAPGAAPIAGGTNLVVDLRSGRAKPQTVINLWQLTDLAYVRRDNGHLAIGGRTTVTQLLNSALVGETGRALTESAQKFASPLIRNRATVGGNLADASPAADLAPPLLVLDAEVQLQSKSGMRTVPLAEFFLGPRQTVRTPAEILAEIRYPVPAANTATTFLKLGQRWEDAISVVSVAASLTRAGDICQTVRLALGAVAPIPRRATQAEAVLAGQKLTDDLLRQAAQVAATEDASPIDDVRGSAEYRRWMVEVLVYRALKALIEEE